jgi:hypothetical protein
MSETLIVCGNYEGNLAAIAGVLNGWQWVVDPFGPEKCFVVHDDRIEPNRHEVDSVSAAFPRAYDADKEVCEEVSLAALSGTIAPLLTRGTLEVVSIGHCYWRSVTVETLAIHADGRVQRKIQTYESDPPDKWHTCSTETFPPGAVNTENALAS